MIEIKHIKTEMMQQGYNPRKAYDLTELEKSIKQQGIINPLIVRLKNNMYEVICGNSRWLVASKLGLKDLPCIVKDLSDEDCANLSYIDNKERKNLSAYEEAQHYSYMRDTYGYSAQQLADKYGVSKTNVIEYWQISKVNIGRMSDRLSKYHLYELSKMINKDNLVKIHETGFNKVYSEWDNKENQEYNKELKHRENIQRDLANKIIENEYTVKETERLVRDWVVRFEERDNAIKLAQVEKIKIIFSSFKRGVSDLTTSLYDIEKGFNNFISISDMISKEFLDNIREDDKQDLLDELEELDNKVDVNSSKVIKENIEILKKKIRGD